MRAVLLGLLVTVGLVVVVVVGVTWSIGNYAVAQQLPTHVSSRNGLAALTVSSSPETEYLVLVDPSRGVMGVYYIDQGTGEVHLKSVRNVHWDLQMDVFNGTSPSPREIREMLK